MKIRVILFLLLAVSSRAQTITGADVTESGDRIRIYLTGLNTNGSYALGWGTNNYPVGNEKIRDLLVILLWKVSATITGIQHPPSPSNLLPR